MPRMDGLELVRKIRTTSPVPILVLTVRRKSAKRSASSMRAPTTTSPSRSASPSLWLESAPSFRRSEGRADAAPLARWGDIQVDRESRTVRRRGQAGHLTPTEFSLLNVLLSKPGAVWTHRQLLSAVWGSAAGISNDTLRVHMGSLRRKLEGDPNRPRWIRTEPWVGYRFTPEE